MQILFILKSEIFALTLRRPLIFFIFGKFWECYVWTSILTELGAHFQRYFVGLVSLTYTIIIPKIKTKQLRQLDEKNFNRKIDQKKGKVFVEIFHMETENL